METTQIRKTLKRIQTCEAEITELKAVRAELAKSEYASATMAYGGGSRSYTRADIGRISDTIKELEREIKSLRKMLASGGASTLWTTTTLVYS